MGRATVTTNSGEGLYTVESDYGVTEINGRIASLQAEQTSLNSAISEITGKIASAESVRSSAQAALNSAIDALGSADPKDNAVQRKSVDEETQKLYRALATKGLLESQNGRAKARLATITQKIETLQGISLTDTRSVWCCDYTDDATGNVSTIEINGEQPQLLIAPGAPSPSASDGLMTHRLAMSPAATFVNVAILPGWQKFAPTYRVGEITAIDYNESICDVDLDAATSSAQGLEINQSDALSEVPIEYQECNAAVFELGDRVVVQFVSQDWEQPKVIGFESNPRPCNQWLWAGVNDRVTDPVTQTNRLTAKINPVTLETVETWSRTGAESVGITRRLLDAPLTRAISGRLEDPRSGTSYWEPDHNHSSSIFGSTVQMSLSRQGGRMLNALYGTGFGTSADDGDRLYDWPEGNFIKVLDDPAVLYAGQKADNGQKSAISNTGRVFMVAGYQIPNEVRTAYAIYDKNGTPLFAHGLGGSEQFTPQGAAAGGGYFAATMEDTNGQIVYLISEATGALVGSITSSGFDTRWRDVAIRSDKLFILIQTGTSGNYAHSVARYSLPGLVFESSATIGWGAVTGFLADLGSID